MSSREYVYHVPRKTKKQSEHQPQNVTDSGSIKQIILDQYDHYQELTRSNHVLYKMNESLETLSQEIITSVGLLQKTSDEPTKRDLNSKLEHLTTVSKKLEQDRDKLLQQELPILYHQWPVIYGLVTQRQGCDRATLVHVLTSFEDYQSGHLTADQAVHRGMDYMTERYRLPNDYFNRSAVGEFNKNITKLT